MVWLPSENSTTAVLVPVHISLILARALEILVLFSTGPRLSEGVKSAPKLYFSMLKLLDNPSSLFFNDEKAEIIRVLSPAVMEDELSASSTKLVFSSVYSFVVNFGFMISKIIPNTAKKRKKERIGQSFPFLLLL